MLAGLTRTYLAPYRRWLTAIVLLQLVATMASLYLPSLNGKIIDDGVAKGDTAYILSAGGMMLMVSLRADRGHHLRHLVRGPHGGGHGPRPARLDLLPGRGFSAQEVSRFGAPTLISRNTNDVTQVQTVTFMAFTCWSPRRS